MRIAVITMIVLAAAWFWTHAPATSAADSTEMLVNGKCTVCHSTERICKQLGRKGSAEWDATVGRMIEKGARVNAEEKAAIAAYLGAALPGQSPLCGK